MASNTQRAAWLEYVRKHALSLEGDAALEKVAADARDKRLILLGESTHGTHEYYVWRKQMSQRLIEEGGIDFIAVEGDWGAIDALNRYVKYFPESGDSAKSILLEFDRWPQWMWANQETVALIEWLREWNREREPEQRVGVHGIDLYGWGESVVQLPVFLELLKEGWGQQVSRDLQPLMEMEGDMQAFQQQAILQRVSTEDTIEAVLHELQQSGDVLRVQHPKSYLQAKQSAGLLYQAKRHMRGSVRGGAASWNPRAEHFMHTVERLLAHYGPGSRGIVWAHNTHIGDSRHTSMAEAGMVTIGQLARQRFGEDACLLVGLASYRGEVVAGREWGTPAQVMRKPDARSTSLDAWLQDALEGAASPVLIPFTEARKDQMLLSFGLQRAIGVTYNPQSDAQANYVPTVLPLRYDLLVFFEQTSPLHPLHP